MVYFGFDDMSHKAEGKKEKEERNNLYIKKDVHNMHISLSSVLLDKSLHLILHV